MLEHVRNIKIFESFSYTLNVKEIITVYSLIFDQPSSLNKLCPFISEVTSKQQPVPGLHLICKPHKSQRIAAKCCKKKINVQWLHILRFRTFAFSSASTVLCYCIAEKSHFTYILLSYKHHY